MYKIQLSRQWKIYVSGLDIRGWILETWNFSHSRRTVVTMCTVCFNVNEHYIRQQILIMGFFFFLLTILGSLSE